MFVFYPVWFNHSAESADASFARMTGYGDLSTLVHYNQGSLLFFLPMSVRPATHYQVSGVPVRSTS
jgi:hypothetical protein